MRYKIIKSLQPLELFDIVTRGFCDNHLPSIKRIRNMIKRIFGKPNSGKSLYSLKLHYMK